MKPNKKKQSVLQIGDCMAKKMETNPAFSAEVMAEPGGEHLNSCFSCGACSGICPVSQAIPEFDPRRIIHMIRMGLSERLLSSDLLWYCSGCRSCVPVCPQEVGFADIIGAVAKLALKKGYVTREQLVAKGKAAEVQRDLCVSCLTCVRVCPWSIPKIDDGGVAVIEIETCRACGICVAECPAQAIVLKESEDERLIAACGMP
ncbi:pyuvate ferredoxin oxidoreductase subunit delta [bacterium BMS3Abin13]|nr:pyuvate ferredoxin oxidoreductase subunit delta [bacterium BMS3Abin13]